MRRVSNQRIGIAIDASRITAVQIKPGRQPRITATAELALADRAGLDDPQATGQALHALLKQEGFTARRAVVGLPAQWIMARQHAMPPMAEHELSAALGLVMERVFSADPSELAVDFVPPPREPAGEPVLVVATAKRRLVQVRAIADAAGLELIAVTPTIAAMSTAARGDAVDDPNASHLLVRATGQSIEWACLVGGQLRQLQQIGVNGCAGPVELADELRRLLDATPQRPRGVSACFEPDASPMVSSAVAKLGLPLLTMDTAQAKGGSDATEAAAACAALAIDPSEAPIDFVNSRLDAAPPRRFGRRAQMVTLAAGIAAVLIVGLFVLVQVEQSRVAELRRELKQIEPQVEAARALIDRVDEAEKWFADRPSYLSALKRVTLAFPVNGDIWVTELSMRAGQGDVLIGRAVATQPVLQLRDELQKSPGCDNVQLLYMREAGRGESQVIFSISLKVDQSVMRQPAGAASNILTDSTERR